MISPDLSRRLGRALGAKDVSDDERRQVVEATEALDQAESATPAGWDDLPADVRTLVEEIEARPDLWS